jgi:predicted ABC-type ATPase
MINKKLRMFAGPNGSGKSTLIEEIRKTFNIGFFINADKIEAYLKSKKFFDCSEFFPNPVLQVEWEAFLSKYDADERGVYRNFEGLKIKENFFTCNQEINSYHAAVIGEFFRENLLRENYTFSFETVMSHETKVAFIRKAKQEGFTTYLYFICTRDPKINVQRVRNRVFEGGHDVGEEKIKSRYFRSLELLKDAFLAVDRAFIIDSSNISRDVILEKRNDDVVVHQETVPDWVAEFLLDKLKLK